MKRAEAQHVVTRVLVQTRVPALALWQPVGVPFCWGYLISDISPTTPLKSVLVCLIHSSFILAVLCQPGGDQWR